VRRGQCEVRSRLPIDAIVDFGIRTSADMRDAREMDHRIDVVDEWRPINRAEEVLVLHDFNAARKVWHGRSSHRGTHLMAVGGQSFDHRPANEARCASDEHMFHCAAVFT
jgi:hypothetical protein